MKLVFAEKIIHKAYNSHEARTIYLFISEMETHLLLRVIDHK